MAEVKQVVIPEPGFYYHHARIQAEADGEVMDVNRFAYEVLGAAYYAQIDKGLVILRPLYNTPMHVEDWDWSAMSLGEFVAKIRVAWSRRPVHQFSRISDALVNQELFFFRDHMYPAPK